MFLAAASFKKVKGFTLIEMVLTIVIIGLLSAIAFPAFVSLSEESHTASASSTFQQFRTSYQMAHTAWYTQGQGNTVTLGNSTVAMSSTGWPQASSATVSGCDDLLGGMLDFPPATRNLFPLTASPDVWGVIGFNNGGSPACLFLYLSDVTPFRYFWFLPSQPDGQLRSFNI